MAHAAQCAVAIWLAKFWGNQSSLAPTGPMAARIEHTFLLIFWITTIVYLIVLAILVYSVAKRRTRTDLIPKPEPTPEGKDRVASGIVGGALGLTAVLLFIMMISSFITSHALGKQSSPHPLMVEVYGHQWWWEVQYPNPAAPYLTVRTANEIHVPVGVPVVIHSTARDVIHSFWAPNIHGKRDLIPGYETDFQIQVDQPGRWRGQCAEFCGEQHAHMSFFIVAEPAQQFNQWLQAQAQSAPEPATEQAQRGKQVFLTHACVMCHTIQGTTANSRVGPDLTHVASRQTIGAGTLPNTIGNLGGWVMNAQSVKPGVRMPPNPMSGEELQDLLAYLGSLR